MARAEFPTAAAWVPSRPRLPKLIRAAKSCEGCDLYKHATQTVFGAGPAKARIMLVGEQPGDREDLAGKPFVGPAGQLLDKALLEAGIDRNAVYVTNAVKHFKFEERGKRRIHAKPRAAEVAACEPWLEAEVAVIQPKLIVALGATAAQVLLGRAFRLTQGRGQFFPHPWGPRVLATVHPSALLRMPDKALRDAEFAALVRDLRLLLPYR
ncbi:MAG: UdgX family uracil-DNA binding protein [Acidobacteriota bacterium]|nr:UdgX family uracil-DNA binding protein [Acidobacteriota bacterium]